MLVGTTQAKAETKYGLKINDVDVTSENCNDLSVIDGVSGTITFDPETYTLTLENATITTQYAEMDAIYIGTEATSQVTIVLKGGNYIKGPYSQTKKSNLSVYHSKPVIITGPGVLNLNQLYFENTLTVSDNAIIYVNEINCTGNLIVNHAIIYTTGSIRVDSFTAQNCYVNWPRGVEFDNSKKTFVINGTQATGITIEWLRDYRFKINGVDITSENSYYLNEIEGMSGKIEYDYGKNILTLDNVTIDNSDIFIENNSNEGLIINLKGENTITAARRVLSIDKSTTIRGDGTLNATTNEFSCISSNIKDAALVIDSCTVNAKGARVGIDVVGNVTIRNANVTIEGQSRPLVAASLALIGCKIEEPSGAAFDEDLKSVAVNGTSISGKVVIKEPEKGYGFWIGDTEVTNYNRKDLSSIPGVSGTAKYDPNKNTLYLDNATISYEGESWGINSSIPLIIHVTGENKLRAGYSMVAQNVIAITGGGIFNIETNGFDGYCVRLENSPLFITNSTVNIKGPIGIYGQEGTNSIGIINSEVTVEGSSYGSISSIDVFVLDGCSIIQPSGATFDESKKAVVLNGAKVTDKIVIGKPYDIVFEKCADSKAETVKLVKNLTGLGLKESNDLVTAAPCIILENVSEEEAISICEQFAALGSTANYYLHGTWALVGFEKVKANAVPAHKQGIYSIDGVYLGTDFDALPKGIYIKDGKKVLK